MTKQFIKYNNIINESKIYKTCVDYEELFNSLTPEIKDELDKLTEYYFNYFSSIDSNTIIISTEIKHIKKIDGLPTTIYFYLIKEYKEYINLPDVTVKLGINVALKNKDYIDDEYMLQNIYLLHCDISNAEMFKNYVYNILFYTYIIVRDFRYSPMLKHLNHIQDIPNLLDIAYLHISLFGENMEEYKCSVCLDNTITKTFCNHVLCQKCYSKLTKKQCPICRKILHTEDVDFEDSLQFFVE